MLQPSDPIESAKFADGNKVDAPATIGDVVEKAKELYGERYQLELTRVVVTLDGARKVRPWRFLLDEISVDGDVAYL